VCSGEERRLRVVEASHVVNVVEAGVIALLMLAGSPR
jgi:hypothetical protein